MGKKKKVSELRIAIVGIKIAIIAMALNIIFAVLPIIISRFNNALLKNISEYIVISFSLMAAIILLYLSWRISAK